jgi:hypothetical protein
MLGQYLNLTCREFYVIRIKAALWLPSTGRALTMRDNIRTNRGANGGHRVGGLFAAAAGEVSGTAAPGGANTDATAFGISSNDGINAGTLPTFDGGYAGTPASLDGANGAYPDTDSTAAAADLSGTAISTFTIMNSGAAPAIAADSTATVTAAAPTVTTLVSFNGPDGAAPWAVGLLADAAGDLFGTTTYGGASNISPLEGTVFEIAKTGGSYASTPTVLVSFNGANGVGPRTGLIADAAGDLFGTAAYGGPEDLLPPIRQPPPARPLQPLSSSRRWHHSARARPSPAHPAPSWAFLKRRSKHF